jgi:mannose-6-phosphate isomerase-like protein (cupin superfamily)
VTDAAHLEPGDFLSKLPGKNGERFVAAFKHGTLEVELYAPRDHDAQTPHNRDEVYVVVSGRGDFVVEDKRRNFGPGDFLFVAAGIPHWFERFSDDLAVWVIFYGPDGGELHADRSEKDGFVG